MLQIKLGLRTAETDRPALVMGIVNVTPDSFYEKSRGGIERALTLIEEGADILDIGGESTRPGHTPVSAEEEIKRILPVIKEIRRHSEIPLSIDTTKLEVFKAASDQGADIWNDVSALSGAGSMNEDGTAGINQNPSEQAADYLAERKASVILMHNGSGNPEQVKDFLLKRAAFCQAHGIAPEKIILDPGIGFGKSTEECIELIKNPLSVTDGTYPLLMALSRKRCIGEMTGRDAENRLFGTLAADLISVQRGAKIIRVHDVSSAIDTLNVMKNLQ